MVVGLITTAAGNTAIVRCEIAESLQVIITACGLPDRIVSAVLLCAPAPMPFCLPVMRSSGDAMSLQAADS